jgi:competence protein ComEC
MALWRTHWRWFGFAPALVGVILVFTNTPPDLYIARDGLTVAIRGSDGVLRLLRKPSDKYSAEEWLKRDGDERDVASAVATPKDDVNCDADGCVARRKGGQVVASALRPTALGEDCATANIVVSASPTRGLCNGPKLVIDRFDVARNGAYAIWLNGAAPQIQTVRDVRGERPWSPPPRHHSDTNQ